MKAATTAIAILLVLFAGVAGAQALPTPAPQPQPTPAPDTRWTDRALILANGLDLGSTIYAMRVNGAVEANPLAGGRLAAIIPIKIAGTVLNVWANRKLAVHHPKLAKVSAWVISAGLTGVAAHNMTIRRPPQPGQSR